MEINKYSFDGLEIKKMGDFLYIPTEIKKETAKAELHEHIYSKNHNICWQAWIKKSELRNPKTPGAPVEPFKEGAQWLMTKHKTRFTDLKPIEKP